MKTRHTETSRCPEPAPVAGQPIYRKSPPFLAPAGTGRLVSSMAIRYGRHLKSAAG